MPDATLTDIFGTDLLFHFDCSVAASICSDTAGTTQSTNGGIVRCLKSASDAALQINVTEATNGPTYRSNYSSTGYPGVEFDGVNDLLRNGSTGASTPSRAWTLTAITPLAVGRVVTRGSNASNFFGLYLNSATVPRYQLYNGSVFDFTITTSGKIVVACVFGANQQQIDALGVSSGGQSSGAAISGSISQELTFGALWTGSASQFGSFVLHEHCGGQTSEWGQVLRAAKLLRTKWGVTDPNATPQTASSGVRSVNIRGGADQ